MIKALSMRYIGVKGGSHEQMYLDYLIDVFDFAGRLIDSFYMPSNLRIAGTDGDRIFVRETDEDELVSIVKYRIVR